MNIGTRIRDIILKPRDEWHYVRTETDSVVTITCEYVMTLAALPAISGFVATTMLGIGGTRASFAYGIAHMGFVYIAQILACYLIAGLTDLLAPRFGGKRGFTSSFKLAAYSLTPSWLSGIFSIIPGFGIFTIVGLYSVYLFFTGAEELKGIRQTSALPFTVAVIGIAVIVTYALGRYGITPP